MESVREHVKYVDKVACEALDPLNTSVVGARSELVLRGFAISVKGYAMAHVETAIFQLE
jgi:hypothetical protein